jgi:hypothetical protein
MDWTKPRSRWSIAKPLLGNLEELFSEAGQPVTLSERNHALLLDLPGLLPRLVKLLASKRLSSVRRPSSELARFCIYSCSLTSLPFFCLCRNHALSLDLLGILGGILESIVGGALGLSRQGCSGRVNLSPASTFRLANFLPCSRRLGRQSCKGTCSFLVFGRASCMWRSS